MSGARLEVQVGARILTAQGIALVREARQKARREQRCSSLRRMGKAADVAVWISVCGMAAISWRLPALADAGFERGVRSQA